jgi:hypothetical protein
MINPDRIARPKMSNSRLKAKRLRAVPLLFGVEELVSASGLGFGVGRAELSSVGVGATVVIPLLSGTVEPAVAVAGGTA